MSKLKSPIFLVYIVTFLFSFPPIVIKLLIQDMSPNLILLSRFIFVAISYPIILKLLNKFNFQELFKITSKELKHFFLLSFFLIADMLLFFHSLKFIDVTIASFLFLTFPIFTLILARIFLNEKISLTDTIATLISFLGLSIMFFQQFNLENLLGQAMALSASILFAFYIIVNRKSSQSSNHYKKTNYLFLFNTLILSAVILFSPQHIEYSFSKFNILLLALLAIPFTLIPFTLQIYSIKYVKSSTFSMILLISPILTILWSFLLLSEIPSSNTILGGLLIVASAIISTYSVEKIFYISKKFPRKIKNLLLGMD